MATHSTTPTPTPGALAQRWADWMLGIGVLGLVVVLIVPVMLDDELGPDHRHMDAAVACVVPGLRPGSTVIFETTLPVGDTREHFAAFIKAEVAKWAKVVRESGAKVD